MNMRSVLNGFRMTFSKTSYIFGGIFVAFIFFLGNVLIKNRVSMSAILDSQGWQGLAKYTLILIAGFHQTVAVSSFISLIITSMLLGLLVPLFLFKIQLTSAGTGLLSTLGVALSLIAPGCAACGIGIAALLGISGTLLNFLPLKGFEFSLLSMLLLASAVLLTADRIAVCELPRRTKK